MYITIYHLYAYERTSFVSIYFDNWDQYMAKTIFVLQELESFKILKFVVKHLLFVWDKNTNLFAKKNNSTIRQTNAALKVKCAALLEIIAI